MKESCHFDLRLSEDLLRKLVVISEAEGRTPNNTMLLMLRNYISYFERAKGKLDPAKLRAVDLEAILTPAEDKKNADGRHGKGEVFQQNTVSLSFVGAGHWELDALRAPAHAVDGDALSDRGSFTSRHLW